VSLVNGAPVTRIALVEDDETIQELLQEALERRGYEVTGYQSLAAARVGFPLDPRPDLILLDLGLPDGCGLELLDMLREALQPCPPVVVLSGRNCEKDLEEGYGAGVDDYLTKPLRTPELLAKCKSWISRARAKAMVKDSEELPGGPKRAFNRFELLGKLGQGGIGVVYRARDLLTGDQVALKVLRRSESRNLEARQRMVREAQGLSEVQARGVVRIVHYGEEQEHAYCAMELVEGPTLQAYVSERGPLSEGETWQLLTSLLEACAALEAGGIVHRDIKPLNLILREGQVDDPVLLDFGLARRPDDRNLTQEGVVLGTPGFMAPEQILGHDIDARTDLFSAGMVARYAVCAKDAFPGLSGIPLLTAIATRPIQLPKLEDPALREVLRRLTATLPEERYSSPREALATVPQLRSARLEEQLTPAGAAG